MSKLTRIAAASLLPLLLVSGAQAAPGKKRHKPEKPKRDPHAVVYLNGEFQVVAVKDLKEQKKKLKKDYKEAVKAWREAKKEARKAHQKFHEKRPKRPKYRVLRTFSTMEAAQAYADKLKEEAEKRKKREEARKRKHHR